MADESSLGDLIVEVKLDDAQYRSQVRQTLNQTITQARTAGTQVKTALSTGFNTAQTVQGLRALQGSLYLVTGQTGFLVIEAGRTAVALSKMAKVSGGLAGAFTAIARSIGPLGLALGAVAGAFLVGKRAVDSYRDSIKSAKEAQDDLREAQRSTDREVMKMTMDPAAFRAREKNLLRQQFPEATAFEIEDLITQRERLENLKLAADAKRQFQAARESAAIEFGGMKASDFMAAGPARELQLLREKFEAMRAAARSGGSGGSFGFGSVDRAAFRFGPGAVGSVIGQQSGTKEIVTAVEEVEKAIRDEFRKHFGDAGNPAAIGPPLPGY